MENVDKSIATVTVIPQQQISNMGARNLLDILKGVPGLGITQSEFGFREIEVRGVKAEFSENVLIMLNGHPVNHNLQNSVTITCRLIISSRLKWYAAAVQHFMARMLFWR